MSAARGARALRRGGGRAERAPLLDPEALARYDGLALHVRRGAGGRPGERRVPGQPQAAGIELEAYAAYAPGDDLRHLDWNAVGRLDTLLIRRFVAERQVVFHLLVDCSASMGTPAGDGKLAAARELAMALAYVALSAGDAVRVVLLGAPEPRVSVVFRQRPSAVRVAAFLAGATARGTLDLPGALAGYARRQPGPGAALLLSDLMLEARALEPGVTALRAARYELALLHVIGASELEPRGHLTDAILADVESEARHPVAITPATLAGYRQVLARHLDGLRALAERTGTLYTRLATDLPVHAFVTEVLPGVGLVRRR